MSENGYCSAVELATEIRHGRTSPVDVVQSVFDRIDERDDEINAFVHERRDEALAEAREAERAVENGSSIGRLHGVPIALKDLDTEMEGVPCTNGLAAFENDPPEETSVIVQRLLDAGAIVVGTTNTPQLGYKGTTDNPVYGPTGTPFDPSKTAGGSSGGAAAAVASGLVPIALGSDAGGSIRIPASCCGVVGLKPTWGVVPLDYRPDGFIHYAPFSTLGGLTRTVEDTALLLDVIAGRHPKDPVSVPRNGVDYVSATRGDTSDLSIAYNPGLDVFPVEPEVRDGVQTVAETLEAAGATVTRIDSIFDLSRDELRRAELVGFETLMATVVEQTKAAGIDLVGEHEDELDPELLDMIENGYEYSGVEYKQADELRSRVYDALQAVLADYDLILSATISVPPFSTDIFGPTEVDGEEIDPHLDWLITFVCNLTGHPAVSIPAGLTDDGLPVGAHLIGEKFDEETLLTAAAAVERQAPWMTAYPHR